MKGFINNLAEKVSEIVITIKEDKQWMVTAGIVAILYLTTAVICGGIKFNEVLQCIYACVAMD